MGSWLADSVACVALDLSSSYHSQAGWRLEWKHCKVEDGNDGEIASIARDQSTLENEAFDTAESSLEENSEEEDIAEEGEELPGRRKTARTRRPKKIFSYDSKGQPYWEET